MGKQKQRGQCWVARDESGEDAHRRVGVERMNKKGDIGQNGDGSC